MQKENYGPGSAWDVVGGDVDLIKIGLAGDYGYPIEEACLRPLLRGDS
jgi:hypothetical protein